MEKKSVSIREYARSLGVSDTAVRKAYKAGKISSKGIIYPEDGSRPYVVVEIANQEWGNNLNLDAGNNLHLAQALEKKIEKRAKSQNVSKAEVGSTPEDVSDDQLKDISDQETYNEAKRQEAVLKVKLLQLDFLEREGELVDKKEVDKQLMEMGIKFRETIEAIPNQVIDTILSQPGRNEAVIYLQNVINEILTRLSKVEL